MWVGSTASFQIEKKNWNFVFLFLLTTFSGDSKFNIIKYQTKPGGIVSSVLLSDCSKNLNNFPIILFFRQRGGWVGHFLSESFSDFWNFLKCARPLICDISFCRHIGLQMYLRFSEVWSLESCRFAYTLNSELICKIISVM